MPKLSREIIKAKLVDEFSALIVGFADTLPALKQRINTGYKFGLKFLVDQYLDPVSVHSNKNPAIHSNNRNLVLLLQKFKITDDELRRHVSPFEHAIRSARVVYGLF